MDLIEAMTIFVEAAELEGFNRAAEKLRINRSVVTRAVAGLEERLNARLFHRTTRRVTLTEIGNSYLADCRDILERIASTEANVTRSTSVTSGSLRVAISSSFALSNFGPALKGYAETYPEINLHLNLLDRQVDIVDEGFDAAIVSSHALSSSTVIIRPLSYFSNVLIASPSYLQSAGESLPVDPRQLADMTLIARSTDEKGVRLQLTNATRDATVHLQPKYTANSLMMIATMTKLGLGFCSLPESLVSSDLANGTLIRILPNFKLGGENLNISLAYPSRKYVRNTTRTFIDYMLAWEKTSDQPPSEDTQSEPLECDAEGHAE